MMAQYNSYTEITTQSGNTQIYIFRKQKKKEHGSEHKKFLRQQKLLGMALIILAIIGCISFPDDCGGCLVAGFMGIARIICD